MIPKINIHLSKDIIRALYKELIKYTTVDCTYLTKIFLGVVSTMLQQLEKDNKLLDIIIYSGSEVRQITYINYPFQIFYITKFPKKDYDRFIRDNPFKIIKNFDMDDYLLINYTDVFWEAKKFQNNKCSTNGRI